MAWSYRTQALDTPREVERSWLTAWAARSEAERLRHLLAWRTSLHRLARAGIARDRPAAAPAERERELAHRILGRSERIPDRFEAVESDAVPELLHALHRVCGSRGAPYALEGSFLCAFYGEPRTTNRFVLRSAVDEQEARAMLRELERRLQLEHLERSDCELIFHTVDRATLVELEFRAPGTRARNEPFFARRRAVVLGEAGTELWLASAEDTILDLLGCSPDRPESGEPSWRDLLGVLKAQGPTLDLAALGEEAECRGRAAVWPRALIEAGLAEPS